MNEEKKIKDDYEYSRDTYYDLIEKGRESLDLMIEVGVSQSILVHLKFLVI